MEKNLKVILIGAGNRGIYTYSELSKNKEIGLEIVSVVEPDDEKREKIKIENKIPDNMCFKDSKEVFSMPKICDAVIIATPDTQHYQIAIDALKKRYHVLLEKPISPFLKECIDVVKAQETSGKVLSVAHVLRYAPFFNQIKKTIDSNKLGKIISIDLLEEVGYWHFAHSYVRGNWSKKQESGPIILTKSCHDLDILNYLIKSNVKEIFSEGSLEYFKKENAPKGSTNRCIENCAVKEKCPYNSERFYLFEKDASIIKWPVNVISLNKEVDSRKKALEKGEYGKCVFKCNNDVCDNQTVCLYFENNVKVNFKLTAFGKKPTRKIKIYLENGEINGDLAEGSIRIMNYGGLAEDNLITYEKVSYLGSHGGGDEFLLKNFVKSILDNDPSLNFTSARDSLDSHLLAFAAEESRISKKPINFLEYKKKLGL
jgi:predicted dehydrogenase